MAERDRSSPMPEHLALGVDIGGTFLKGGLVDDTGRLRTLYRLPTPASQGAEAVIQAVASLIEHILSDTGLEPGTLRGVGIGCGGQLDIRTGVIVAATDIIPGWAGVPIRQRLQAAIGLPVVVDNDSKVAALAEYRFGAGRGADALVCMTIGTGIGGGIILDGRLVHGTADTAGHVGHIVVEPDGRPCGCGGYGCLEAHASGGALVQRARTAIRQGATTQILHLAAGDEAAITPKVICDAARAGDPLAMSIIGEAGRYLGLASSTLVNLLDPALIVVGGGVAQAGELLLEPMRQVVAERALPWPRSRVQIVPAQLGEDAGVIGAASLVLE